LLLAAAIGFGAWMIVNALPLWQPTKDFLPWVRSTPSSAFTFDALRGAVALLPATLLWGASFPLTLAVAPRPRRQARTGDLTRHVSRITAINTAGALAGTLTLTLIGIPVVGSQVAQQFLVVVAALAGLGLLWTIAGQRRDVSMGLAVAVAAVAIAIVPAVPGQLIAYGRSVNSWASIERFLYIAEGATASVAVTEHTGGTRQFHIAGKVEASDLDVDMRLERIARPRAGVDASEPEVDPDRWSRRGRHCGCPLDPPRGRANCRVRDRAHGAGERAQVLRQREPSRL